MRLLFATLVFVCGVVGAIGQTLTPNTFDMGPNAVGVPKSFLVTLHNTHPAPQWIVEAKCAGEADLEFVFLNASDSSTAIGWGEFVLPDSSRNLIIIITPKSAKGLVQLECAITFHDSIGDLMDAAEFSVTGPATKSAVIAPTASTTDFGSIGIGTGAASEIVLNNTGDAEAFYRVIDRPSAPFSLVDDAIWRVGPGDSVIVRVAFEPTAVGTYVDTVTFGHAYLTEQTPLAVELRGSMTATSVDEVESACLPHPNPSNGHIKWCGSPSTTWSIVNAYGVVVALVDADVNGNCRWTADLPGVFFMQNTRTMQTLSVVVLH